MTEDSKPHSFAGTHDPLVVSTEALAKVLEFEIAIHENHHPRLNPQGSGVWGRLEPLTGGGWVVEASGISHRKLYSILRRETKTTTLRTADKILSAVGQSHALDDGRIPVVPNPAWTQERWHKYMAERGCEPE